MGLLIELLRAILISAHLTNVVVAIFEHINLIIMYLEHS